MREVSLEEGLTLLQSNGGKLKSDGLAADEYIYYRREQGKVGFWYEDNTYIGYYVEFVLELLVSLKWVLNHKFFYEED